MPTNRGAPLTGRFDLTVFHHAIATTATANDHYRDETGFVYGGGVYAPEDGSAAGEEEVNDDAG